MTTQQYDYIVIGSGIAGLYSALLAVEHGSVLILTKGGIADCNTQYAQGGIAAAVGPEDSPSYHLADTLAAGAGLCNEDAARILAEEGPQAISELVRLGVIFDTADGEVALGREAAHRMPRVLHAGGDATGARIELTLSSLAHHSRIHVEEFVTTTRLLVEDGRVVGVAGLVNGEGEEVEYLGAHTVLATGGAGRLYRYTTNPEVTTGDGVALAFDAGAAVMDMEFYQFHPTARRLPGAPPFLITEAMRGEGAVLRNARGEAFMPGLPPAGRPGPARRGVAVAAGGDAAHGRRPGRARRDAHARRAAGSAFPQHLQDVPDPRPRHHARADTRVAGGALHDGRRAHEHGRRDDAAGVVRLRRGRVHGAARGEPAGEQLAAGDGGLRAARRAADAGGRLDGPTAGGGVRAAGRAPRRARARRRWRGCRGSTGATSASCGRVKGLEEAAGVFSAWEASAPDGGGRGERELANMVTLGRLMAESALVREESRGAHFRTDFPETSEAWVRHTVFMKPERE